jgi:hypothetical protein
MPCLRASGSGPWLFLLVAHILLEIAPFSPSAGTFFAMILQLGWDQEGCEQGCPCVIRAHD